MHASANSPPSLGTWDALRLVADRFRPYRWRLLTSMVLVLTAVGLSMLWPLLLKVVINQALPEHRTGLLAALCLAMIAAGILSTVIMVGQGALANSLGQAVVHRLRADVYDTMQAMPVEFFAGEPNTDIQALLASDIGGISDLVTFTAQGALAAAVNLLAASLVMLVLSWPLALVSLLLAGGLNLANSRFTAKRRALATARQAKVADMLRAVGEDLTMPGVILGRTLGRCPAQRQRFLAISEQISALTCQQRLAGSSARALIGVTLACLPPAIYWLSGTLVPSLSLGAVVVLSTMQVRVSSPIQQLLSLNGEMQASLAMFDRVFACLGLQAPARQPAASPAGSRPVLRADSPRTLRARDVSFRYSGAARDALRGIDLTLRPGSTTVIAGTSGSGKSTLALLLAGLMAPSSGVLELDGRPAHEELLRANVTLLAQEGATFNASLRDNLLFARPDATEAELGAAISAAGLAELVTRLGRGLDTLVGERGYQLSGGERQRVALARALLVPSPILIADEASSALDVATADLVHRSLCEHARAGALVVIAHRIPQLAAADQVVLLERGRITETGSHAELLSRSSAYADLVRMAAAAPPAILSSVGSEHVP
jgi:ATP-binding cassette subfamily B protein